ncbi:VOC family protein [Polaribacter sp. HL-MS24]|uniref:VOC family protein n=1 Tax=Polaribacter sp. HL-MS24 TaxID=3077735 RepID=UPI00293466A0|nr:VOC family protein [Polaribacter sp. HL-MS24]WOC40317.1 VOC family protein [Polaribacter sp. HL-MS24]
MRYLTIVILVLLTTNSFGQSKKDIMEQRLTIITLGVSNLKKSTDFYETKFGWKKSVSSNQYISFFTLNGIQLALYDRKELAEDATVNSDGNGFKGFTLAYNTKSEKEVDQLIEELRINGVEIVKEPQKVNWGGYSSYISDLDGNLWEIACNPFLGIDEKGNVKE